MKKIACAAILLCGIPMYSFAQGPRAFRDEFAGQLKPGWQWIDPKGDCANILDARKGFLRIAIPGGRHDLYTARDDYYAPRMMRGVDGDFTLETKIAGPGRADGGLLVWKDYRNFVRFERGIHFKNHLNLQAAVDGKFYEIASDYVEGDDIWLRLERRGSTYTAAYSLDGKQWRPISRKFAALKRPVAQDRDDWMEGLKEDDFIFESAPGSVEMKAPDPLLVGISAHSKGPERVIDYDYFEIKRK